MEKNTNEKVKMIKALTEGKSKGEREEREEQMIIIERGTRESERGGLRGSMVDVYFLRKELF